MEGAVLVVQVKGQMRLRRVQEWEEGGQEEVVGVGVGVGVQVEA